jgi:tetratricopeptide (TPR) repeat protein
MTDDLQARYLEGVALWRERDIPAAVEALSSVVSDGRPDDAEIWWHSASRALAQIALESDDIEKAEWHLRRLPGSGVGDAQTLALRGRRWFQMGDEEPALGEIDMAAMRLASDKSDDIGSLMNGAIALIWCAEILTELGYADDASALIARARGRMAAARVDDRVLKVMLSMVEASVARLAGNFEAALSSLDQADTSLSPDLLIQVTRERARIAATAQESGEAAQLYERCLELARDSGYVFLERSISKEVMAGPPRLRTDRAPIGQWDPRAMENVPEMHLPYAVVIRLPLRNETEILEFESRLTNFLRDQPDLGYIDGTGTDGEIWEIFLDGDDADALWDAVRPLLQSPPLWRHAEITKRHGSGSYRFRAGPPSSWPHGTRAKR